MPRYFTTAVCGMGLPFKETDGHLAFFKVNVICADLFSLATILHFLIHSWISSKVCCKIEDAISGFLFTAMIAVSSANVAVHVCCDSVKSDVHIEYIKLGPEHLPAVHQIIFCGYLYIDFLLL